MSEKPQKIIRSHQERVKAANQFLRESRNFSQIRINIFDREAFVEFFLLEDILCFYESRLKTIKDMLEKNPNDRGIQYAKGQYEALIKIWREAVEATRANLYMGNFTAVWQAIQEHILMVGAKSAEKSEKYLPQMREMVSDILRKLNNAMLGAIKETLKMQDFFEELDEHTKNALDVIGVDESSFTIDERAKNLLADKGINIRTNDEIEAIISDAEKAIPDEEPKRKSVGKKSILE